LQLDNFLISEYDDDDDDDIKIKQRE